MKKTTLILILALFIASCDQEKSARHVVLAKKTVVAMEAVRDRSMNPPSSPVEKIENSTIDKKKIIKDGRLELKVTDLEKSKSQIDALVNRHSGYYATESLNNSDYESSYSLKIRIPSANLEKFIAEIESGDGQVVSKEIDARDVTEEFIDLETRLDNKRSYLKRYNELLTQAKTVKDILEIQDKTRVIEEEIDSSEGRLKYLNDLVAFSTLNLNITKEREFKFNPASRDRFTERLKQSLSNGWYVFIDFILLIIKLWPFWILLAIMIPLWKRLKIRRKNKNIS